MAAAPSSEPKPSTSAIAAATQQDLLKQIRSREIAIAELSSLPSTRAVYQRKGNIFFQTSIPKATASEEKQLDITKAKLQEL